MGRLNDMYRIWYRTKDNKVHLRYISKGKTEDWMSRWDEISKHEGQAHVLRMMKMLT